MYYVYGLFDPINQQLFYIGKGKIANKRHRDHLTARRGKENKLRWQRICHLRKAGVEPEVRILIENIEDENTAYEQEAQLIKQYGKIIDHSGILTNILDDARPPSWKVRTKTESHRKNLSLAHLGKKLSEETKRKIIETKQKNQSFKSGMEGKTHSTDTRSKISEAKKNIPMSIESSIKKSVKLKGKPWSAARRLAALTQRKSGPKPK